MTTPPPSPPIVHEDIMVEILSWIPVKSLMRFRCVSKSLKSLISNPTFVKLHLQRSPKNSNLLLKLRDSSKHCFALSHSVLENPSRSIVEDLGLRCEFNLEHKYKVVGSCNGLVCFVAESTSHLCNEYQVHLWNPATRLMSQNLPYMDRDVLFGFGYDSLSGTYKVVETLFKSSGNDNLLETKVCNIGGDNCWRNIENFPGVPYVIQCGGVHLSGTLSWLALPIDFNINCSISLLIDQLVIVSLDLGNETFSQLSLPRVLDEANHDFDEIPIAKPSLNVLKDCLCFSYDYNRTHFVIWQMKEHGVESSWSQLFSFSYQCLQIDPLSPMCMHTFENDAIMIATRHGGLQAVWYYQRDNKVEHTRISNNIVCTYAMDYVQSLVSPCWN